ncbi:hypothetical protein PSH25_005416, partial [Micromonospora sp. PSH25]|nr:hypothetical protein [Micromonospora foliorum]
MSADLNTPAHTTDAAEAPHRRSVPTPREPVSPAALAAPADVAHASDRGARIAAVVIALAWHVAIALPPVLSERTEFAEPAVVHGAWILVAVTGAVAGVRLL